jgi:hypothetical protein
VFSRYRGPRPQATTAPWLAAASEWLQENALAIPDDVSAGAFYGRVVLYGLFVLWGLSFVTVSLERSDMASSFLHLINLVFHEAGHAVLMPLGWPLLISLGGTLGQLAIPLVCMLVFLLKTRDPFAASIALWWLGQNFLDIAPYMGDARALQLILLGGYTGQEVEGHDWEAILGALGWLRYDRTLAGLTYNCGRLVMVGALVWGGWLLALQRQKFVGGAKD